MEAHIGIKQEHLSEIANSLSRILADEFLLYTKTRNAHWNVEGKNFHSMHTFFEEQYEQLDEIMDSVAERIRMIGHYAPATLKSYLSLTHLTEMSRQKNDSVGYISELLSDHESIIKVLRVSINHYANDFHDIGSSDFITSLMEDHEKMSWQLRAHLKN